MIHVIDVGPQEISVRGYEREGDIDSVHLPTGSRRFVIREQGELSSLDNVSLLGVYNFLKVGKPVAKLQSRERGAASVWNLLTRNTERSPDPQQGTTVAASAASGSPSPQKDDDMAKKKAKTNGSSAPREGSKAHKLLQLVSRPDGATLAEMLNATGWKECRGTALLLARRVGKKLTLIKGEDGKVNRWKAV